MFPRISFRQRSFLFLVPHPGRGSATKSRRFAGRALGRIQSPFVLAYVWQARRWPKAKSSFAFVLSVWIVFSRRAFVNNCTHLHINFLHLARQCSCEHFFLHSSQFFASFLVSVATNSFSRCLGTENAFFLLDLLFLCLISFCVIFRF